MDRTQGLVAFVRVVEAGSFSAAAGLLGTTPSAVSRSITRLEKRLSTRLFRRSTRHVVLTHEGQAYFDRVAPMLHGIEEADEVLRASNQIEGVLRVSLPTVLGPVLMTSIVTTFLTAHPRLRVQASITDRHVSIISEAYDVALRAAQLPDSGLTARSLGTLALRLVASPQYLDQAGRPQSREDLKSHRHIRYLTGNRPYPLIFADGARFMPTGHLDVDNGSVMLRAVLAHGGIAPLLDPVVAQHVDQGHLEQVLADDPLQRVPLHFLHAYSRRVPMRVRAFMDFVSGQLANLER